MDTFEIVERGYRRERARLLGDWTARPEMVGAVELARLDVLAVWIANACEMRNTGEALRAERETGASVDADELAPALFASLLEWARVNAVLRAEFVDVK